MCTTRSSTDTILHNRHNSDNQQRLFKQPPLSGGVREAGRFGSSNSGRWRALGPGVAVLRPFVLRHQVRRSAWGCDLMRPQSHPPSPATPTLTPSSHSVWAGHDNMTACIVLGTMGSERTGLTANPLFTHGRGFTHSSQGGADSITPPYSSNKTRGQPAIWGGQWHCTYSAPLNLSNNE